MEKDVQNSRTSLYIDRTRLVPPHEGYHIFPNIALFSTLLRHAHRNHLAIRDVRLGIQRTYGELLSEALGLRHKLQKSLDPEVLRAIKNGDEVFIGVLAAGGYEFAVAALAVLALGAAMVPMSMSNKCLQRVNSLLKFRQLISIAVSLPVKEALYFVGKSKQVAILTSAEASTLGTSIADEVNKSQRRSIQSIDILSNLPKKSLQPSEMIIAADRYLDPNAAGVVIFTSGTTGPPKGAVMRRSYVDDGAAAISEHYRLTPEDVLLHVLPVHHATGIGINFWPFLMSGCCIEFRSGSFDPDWMWERWRQGGLTFFSAVPTIYMRMMRYYEQNLASLPEDIRISYVQGAKQFRAMLCGSSALPRPMQDFWTNIRGGKAIYTRYGATEFGAVYKVGIDDHETPPNSVGKAVSGVDVKLSNGDEGEVLVKSPHMFSKSVLYHSQYSYKVLTRMQVSIRRASDCRCTRPGGILSHRRHRSQRRPVLFY